MGAFEVTMNGIECDAEGCGAEFYGDDDENIDRVRNEAESQHWKCDPFEDRDFCPRHAAAALDRTGGGAESHKP